MLLNSKKTKNMIFNYSNDYQFSTRMALNNESIEVLKSTKLLGTIISDDLKWSLNTKNIVKKANARMQLLRKVASFGASEDDLKNIYFLYVRSQLEQSAVVWHSGLTEENAADLERVQKTAVKIILKNKYNGYKKSLIKLDMETLHERRNQLSLNFAIKSTKNKKMKYMFPRNIKSHLMKTRNPEKFQVQFAKTERLKKSAIISMQNLLNEHHSNMQN